MRQRRDPPRPTTPRQSKGGAVRYRPQRIRLYTIRPAPGTPAPDTPAHQLTPVLTAWRRLGSYLQFRFTTPPVPHSPEAPAPHSPVPFTQVAAFCTGRSPCTPILLIARNAWSGGRHSPARHADTPPATWARCQPSTLPRTPRRHSARRAGPWPGPYTDSADSATRPLGRWTPARPPHERRGPSGPSRRRTPRRRVPDHRRPTLKPFQTVDTHSGPPPTRAAHPEGYSGGQQRNSRFCRNLRIRTDPTSS